MSVDDVMELYVERPAAGGRMIARHDGLVVFVAGAVPGERVRVRVERRSRHLVWANVIDVIDPSPDRRHVTGDASCGGMTFAHIDYHRQLALKAEILVDAFRRIGHLALPDPVTVHSSEERGYRLRARFHVAGERAVFFREGTHEPCDPASTGQLSEQALDALGRGMQLLSPRLGDVAAVVLTENVRATERALHFEARDGARLDDLAGTLELPEGVTGMTTRARGRAVTLAGSAVVTDTADALFGGTPPIAADVSWARHASSFFQGNRFLTGELVRRVLAESVGERVVDLYAGVGLFAVALAARGAEVVAVEGDRSSAADLAANARPWQGRLRVLRRAVEQVVVPGPDPAPDVVVLDPPRSGMSAEALAGLVSWNAPRLVYVSCDPATLARDAARLVAGGYHLTAIEAFDLFPGTPHVETLAAFDQSRSA